jgi:P2 family phage contractile tail tube protein
MVARQVLKNLNLFVDGKGQAGQIEDFNPPKLELKVDEFRGGGMDGTVDIEQGLQKLTTDFSLIAYDPDVLALFGLRSGTSVPLVAKGALEDHNGNVTAVSHTMRGKVTSMDPGTWKAGEKAPLKTTLTLTYYKLQHGDRVIHEIDIENFIRIVDGVDMLAAQRAALGI